MKIGMLTAPFGQADIDTVIEFAAEADFDCLEIAVNNKHCDLETTNFDRLQESVSGAGLEISSLAAYVNITAGDPTEREKNRSTLKRTIEAVVALECDCVCCMAGLPPEGKTREQTIVEDAAPYFREICAFAADRGVRLALENWTATNIRSLAQWELLIDETGADNLGFNYDPSHLYWQDIDYLMGVEKFADRIFHVHAKDTEVVAHKKAWLGNQETGWWRYCIPGFGEIDWGVFCARLRRNGYNGVLSIEHEDAGLGREEGFVLGLDYLRQFADGS